MKTNTKDAYDSRPQGIAKAILFTGLFLPSVTAGPRKSLGKGGLNIDNEIVNVSGIYGFLEKVKV